MKPASNSEHVATPKTPRRFGSKHGSVSIKQVLSVVAAQVEEIDRQCKTRLNGIEHGLVNVKREFRERAFEQTGYKLTEEKLIHWLLRQNLLAMGIDATAEVRYPNDSTKSCDLVVGINEAERLWLEVKLAWKAWFNCSGEASYTNGWYRSYMDGTNRSHSFRQDLEKMSRGRWYLNDYRAVCLIGADWREKPMEPDVSAIVTAFRKKGHCWKMIANRHWRDRRCSDFGLHVWCWLLTTTT